MLKGLKNPACAKDFNGIVIVTLCNSSVSDELQVRLAFTSWG